MKTMTLTTLPNGGCTTNTAADRTVHGCDGIPSRTSSTSGYTRFFCALLAMLAMVGIILPSDRLLAQNDPCFTDTLRLNTGYDHNTNSVIGIGQYNLFWRVIADPDPGTTEPRPSVAINPHPAWFAALPGTRWISSYPTAQNDRNGLYVFEACFCLKEKFGTPKIDFTFGADDSAAIFLNGNYIGSTTGGFTTPTHIVSNNPQLFRPGKNCIQVRLHNIGSVAMGFDLSGYIYTNGVGLIKPKCCDSTGAIIGQKFNDLNCNGKKDPGEPGLAGWTIQLSNSWTAVTDVLGNYYFFNVPAGTYIVNEVNQAGWTQTYPASLTYTVTVGAGQVIANTDFGNCRKQTKDTCIFFGDNTIECTTLPGTTQKAYKLTQWMKSNFPNCPQQVGSVVGVSPAGVTVTPGSFSISSTYSPTTFYIYGPGATAGTTVTIVLQVCCFDAAGTERCCTDTLRVKLPPCPDGCFRILEQKIDCKWTPNGNVYTYCFNFLNQSSFTAYYFQFAPKPGISIAPSTVLYPSGVAPSTASPFQCVTISGPNAIPGSTITLVVRMCNKERTECCIDSFRVTLPDCGPKDCCTDFRKLLGHLQNSASTNGNASLGGFMAVTGSGGSSIMSVSATLVSVSVNGQPAYGYMTGGAISGGWGAGVVPPPPGYPYPHDIVWPNGPGLPGNAFKLAMKFPPMGATWHDVLRYCIRFRFTDRNCVTCDTVICITRHRYKIIWWDDILRDRGTTDEKGGERNLQSAGSPTLSGTLGTGDSGTVQINFPVPPSELGQVKYIGLNITPADSGVSIENGMASKSGYDLFFVDGAMVGFFNADPNDNVAIDLQYAGLDGRRAARHNVELVYTVTYDDGGVTVTDTLTEETTLTLRRAAYEGGDQVGPTLSGVQNVRTYAIHLRNANGSKAPVAAFSISEPGVQKVIAVGPVSEGPHHVFSVGKRIDKMVPLSKTADSVVEIAPDEEMSPIYVTLANVDGSPVTLDFTTYDAEGQVITRGQFTLADAISGVEGGNDEGAAATMLRQSFPNPAAHSATIGFTLPTSTDEVSLLVTDASGRVVARLMDGERMSAGEHAVFFDTANLPSGTYYYTLRAGSTTETRSMQVVK